MENKKNNTLVVIICVVAFILIIVTGFVAYTYGANNSKEKEVVVDNKEEVKEKDITNKANREFFLEKISTIEKSTLKGIDDTVRINTIYSKDEVGTENLDTNSMYASVFNSYAYMFEDVPKKLNDLYDEQANYKVLLEKVKNFYGNIDEFTGAYSGCPSYTLKNSTIYLSYRCGYGPGPKTISYLDKITELDKDTYVYVYVGSYEPNEKDNTNIIYSDPTLETKYKAQSIDASFSFSEKDYKNFTPFRYTFIKNADGYYIFSKLEKITK